ncbi:MAG: AAA family ATPase [Candidatus Aenigmarchaeota archaeon]|nr:AAA family ATPase [Candidatus Aenigmarchaeota archaeon]
MKKHEDVILFGWNENPFTFKILPDIFIGYENEIQSILSGIKGNSKVTIILGPTGSGKTTLLKHLIKNKLSSKNILYLPKPPRDPADLVNILMNFTKNSIFRKLLSRKKDVNLYNIADYMNSKIKNGHVLLVIDEANESTTETMEWLRTLSDQITNMTLVMAGLPVLENKMKSELETFYRRIDNSVKLTNLNQMETRELIKRRIERAGGEGLKPFTPRMVDMIYEKTGGFPREILRMCNSYVNEAIKKNITMIDVDLKSDIEDVKEHSVVRNAPAFRRQESKTVYDSIEEMPQKQKDIIDILSSHIKGLTPTEIVSKMNLKSYKNRDNAIRSVNNILRRMGDEGSVIRERRGKAYKYSLSGKLRTATVKS